MKTITIEIELHDKWDLPARGEYLNGDKKALSVSVFAMDEENEPAALYFNFITEEWEEMCGEEIGEIDFKWFHLPKELKNV